MKCINFRLRTQKGKHYSYCALKKTAIDYKNCYDCVFRTYKKIKNIKYKKHNRTKATEIQKNVKEIIWLRDNRRCIFCGKYVEKFYANAHFVPRSAGGLGIEQNIFTACPTCHSAQDNGLDTEKYDKEAERHLRNCYSDWDINKLIYRKEKNKNGTI